MSAACFWHRQLPFCSGITIPDMKVSHRSFIYTDSLDWRRKLRGVWGKSNQDRSTGAHVQSSASRNFPNAALAPTHPCNSIRCQSTYSFYRVGWKHKFRSLYRWSRAISQKSWDNEQSPGRPQMSSSVRSNRQQVSPSERSPFLQTPLMSTSDFAHG